MSINAVGSVEQKQQSPLLYGAGGAAAGAAAAGGGSFLYFNNAVKRGTATDATKETVDAFVKSTRVQKAAVKAAQEARSGLETAQKEILNFVNAQAGQGATPAESYTRSMLNVLDYHVERANHAGATDEVKGVAKKAQDLIDKIKGTEAVKEVKDGAEKITKKAVKGLEEQAKEFDGLYTLKDSKEVLKEGDELGKSVESVYKSSKEPIIDKLKSMNKSTAIKVGLAAAAVVGVVAALIISSKNKKAAAEAQAQVPEAAKHTTQG